MKVRSSPAGDMQPDDAQLFLHEILSQDVRRSIFVDTDAIFISDPTCKYLESGSADRQVLWKQFNDWGPTHAVSIPHHPAAYNPEWKGASKICSCVLMLDHERLVRLF